MKVSTRQAWLNIMVEDFKFSRFTRKAFEKLNANELAQLYFELAALIKVG